MIDQQHGLFKCPHDHVCGGTVFRLVIQENAEFAIGPEDGPKGRGDDLPELARQSA